jgi:3-hydroxybutyrate dehydrogenase
MILQGKTAVITGSTSGIGLAYAKALAAEGASLVINGFGDAEAIEAIRAELAATSGATALYDAADMTKPDQIAALIDRAVAETGRIDIAINNAGIQHVSPIEDFPDDKMEAIIRINLLSAWYVAKAAVPHMKRQGWGRIITTASAHSLVASPNKSAYVMAKHGIAGLTKTLALETATHGITVNCISPGYVWTPLVEAQIPDTMKARGLTREQVMNDVLLAAQPTKEFVTPEQVAALAVFLCRDEAKAITGANLSVDGGWTAA